jgi:Uma2 family endonuclease
MTRQLEKIGPLVDSERVYTLDEFLNLDLPDDMDFELWGGRLVAKPKSGISGEHGKVVAALTEYLRNYVRQHNLGTVYSGASTNLGSTDPNPFYVAPDVCFVVNGRTPPRFKGSIPVAPDLVVEVHSPSDSTEKIQEKIEIYQAAQVPVIWSVWMMARFVVVYHHNDPDMKMYNTHSGVLAGSNVLPGFQLPVSAIFE